MFNKMKENDKLKSFEVDVVTKFIKEEVESSIYNIDVDVDDDVDDEQDGIVKFI